MQILPISGANYNKNLTFPKTTYATQPKIEKELKTDKISYCPISFRGNSKSSAIKNMETFIDDFYEKNKGKKALSVHFTTDDFTSSSASTMSYPINKSFARSVECILESKAILLDEKGYATVMQACIDDVNETLEKHGGESLGIARIDDKAEDIIARLQEDGTIPEELAFRPFDEGVDYIDYIASEILKGKNNGVVDEDTEQFLSDALYESYLEHGENPPVTYIDEDVHQKLRGILSKDEFKAFNEKMLKVEAQDKVNGSKTPDEVSEELYQDLMEKQISPFENPKLYNYLQKNSEKLDFILEKTLDHDYDNVMGKFKQSGMNERHKALLVDPGVYANFDDLVSYVKNNNVDTDSLNPYELREKFSKDYGTDTVYRGLYSDKPEELIEKLKSEGNYTALRSNPEKMKEAIKYYLSSDGTDPSSVRSKIYTKISDRVNEFLSVSYIYDVAASVQRKKDLLEGPKDSVVVIKTEVPKLSIIKQKGLFNKMQTNSIGKDLWIGDKRYSYDSCAGAIEAFVPFHLPTQNAEFTDDRSGSTFSWG